MLADGLAGLLVLARAEVGVVCLAIAILVEIPIFGLIWKRFSWRVVILIVVANIVSAFIGGIPSESRAGLGRPDVLSDPWIVYNSYWYDFLPWIAILFLATCMIEGLCFLPLRFNKTRKTNIGPLLVGTIAGNVASYLVLIGIIWYVPPRGTGDFEFLPDASWVNAGDQRVWFVDSDSQFLYSIRLNGSDRRREADHKLHMFDWIAEDTCVYAVVPENKLILYVDADRNWRLRKDGKEKVLSQMDSQCMRSEIFELLPELLPGAIKPANEEENVLKGVYFSAGVPYWRGRAISETYKVDTHWVCAIGPHYWGVTVSDNSDHKLKFGIKHNVTQMFCRNPEIINEENLILFSCGGWIMVMDPIQQKVSRLTKGKSMMVLTPYFASRWPNFE